MAIGDNDIIIDETTDLLPRYVVNVLVGVMNGIQLPPKAIITRWGTWLDAVFYNCQNLEKFKSFVLRLEDTNKTIIKLKEVLNNDRLQTMFLDLIGYNLKAEAILKLEKHNLSLSEQSRILLSVKSQLKESALQKLVMKDLI